jgi:DNA polymerase-3 subunit chi
LPAACCARRPEQLGALDRALWVFEERDFVPHVRMPGAAPAVARRTPIWLAPVQQGGDAPPVLVNLGAEPPAELAALQRLIEIVGADADEAAAGRARWRHYKVQGLAIKHHGGAETARG